MNWFGWLVWVQWGIRLAMVPVVLKQRIVPSAKLAWLSVTFLMPEVGLLLYLLLGKTRLGNRRVKRYRMMAASLRPQLHRQAEDQTDPAHPKLDPAQIPIVRQAQQVGGMAIHGSNDVTFLGSTEQTTESLITEIARATHHVHLLFYIFEPDEVGQRVAQAVMAAAGRGVACRVLADAVGSRRLFARRGLAWEMRQHGVEVYPALPAKLWRQGLSRLDLRNHRKIAVVDGRVAFTGSRNVIAASHGHRRAGRWVDLTGRFTGPIVNQLQVVFLEDWTFETGQMLEGPQILPPPVEAGEMFAQAIPSGPTHDAESFRRVLLTAINVARRKIIITTPYLVLDEPTQIAIAMAVDRGVEVHIVLPRKTDHPLVSLAANACVGHLLEAGVHLYHFDQGMLHAKTMTVDDTFALLGSANLDIRSFDLNFEVNVLLYGKQITSELRFVQQQYLSEAVAVDSVQWKNRSCLRQYLESAAALFSPLL